MTFTARRPNETEREHHLREYKFASEYVTVCYEMQSESRRIGYYGAALFHQFEAARWHKRMIDARTAWHRVDCIPYLAVAWDEIFARISEPDEWDVIFAMIPTTRPSDIIADMVFPFKIIEDAQGFDFLQSEPLPVKINGLKIVEYTGPTGKFETSSGSKHFPYLGNRFGIVGENG